MSKLETRWLYVTSEELVALREKTDGTCILPMGCVEKHGLHLPLGTDSLQAGEIAFRASQMEPVAVFPDFIFGDIGECTPNTPPGTISLPMETQMLLLGQLCGQIVRNGFRRIIIFNGHGGNRPLLNTFLQEINKEKHNYQVHLVHIHCDVMKRIAKAKALKGLQNADRQLAETCKEKNVLDGHAGYSETAYMMGIAPKCVHMNRLGIVSGKSTDRSHVYDENGIQVRDQGWEMDFPHWIDSDEPIGCNERIGEAALRLEAERVAGLIRKFKREK